MSRCRSSSLRARSALVALASCVTPVATAQDAGANPFEFLAARHDADHDGRITREEYSRGEESFARLDTDHDGEVTPADFAAGADSRGPSPEERRSMLALLAPSMLVKIIGPLDADEISRDLLATRVDAIDADDDGIVSGPELEADQTTRDAGPFRAMGLDRRDLLAAAAADGAPDPRAALRVDALLAWFDRLDADHDGRLAGAEIPDLGKAGRKPRDNEEAKNARAARGEIAPDFTLSSEDGTRRVTLSSFAGDRPVALIFGSFT